MDTGGNKDDNEINRAIWQIKNALAYTLLYMHRITANETVAYTPEFVGVHCSACMQSFQRTHSLHYIGTNKHTPLVQWFP